MEDMENIAEARRAENVQPVRDWTAFAVRDGHIVYRGRHYFAWSPGHFIGAYDSLDDAIESLAFRERGYSKSNERRTARANDVNR